MTGSAKVTIKILIIINCSFKILAVESSGSSEVDKKAYNQLNKGDMGIISYCGMKYLGFRKAC